LDDAGDNLRLEPVLLKSPHFLIELRSLFSEDDFVRRAVELLEGQFAGIASVDVDESLLK